MTKIIFGINVPYQSKCINWEKSGKREYGKPLIYDPCIRTHKEMFFGLCDICGSQVPPGRVSRGITTCCPKCNEKKWDAKNGLVIQKEKAACGVRPTSFWLTISGECFKRDRYSCVKCNSGEKIECHHIKRIKDGGNNQLENLITLCRKCHKIEHSHARNVARKHRPLVIE